MITAGAAATQRLCSPCIYRVWCVRTDRWDPFVQSGHPNPCCSSAFCFWAWPRRRVRLLRAYGTFYVLFGVLAPIGLAAAGSPILNPTIMNWFATRRGTALGLAQTGGGLSFVFVFMMEFVITEFGWRTAYIVLGFLTIAVLLPIVLLKYSFSPKERGMTPYGSAQEEPEVTATSEITEPVELLSRASGLRSSQLWLLFISNMLFWGTGCYLILAHQVRFAIDAGFSSTVAASTSAAFGIFMVLGQASLLFPIISVARPRS